MMPFVVHERRAQLPAELQTYMHVIDACVRTMSRPPENTPIGYLTVHESNVEDGASQRRPGLHVESPGLARGAAAAALAPGAHHHWGRGIVMKDGSLSGGIFMASSVDDTCRLWNCRVRDDQGDIVGPGGDCERLRPLLKHVETDTLRANELAWMSDMTPHESLPLKGGGRRQYFRLVVGEVSAWYAAHSTPNPNFDLASAPGGPAVVAGDKFANAGAYAWTRGAAAAGAYDPADDRARTSFRKAMARAGLEHRLDFFAACGVRRFADLRGKGAELRRGLDHWDQTRLRYALKKPGVLWYETAPDSGEE
ncbi:hypothetical protein JL721_4400 [Aureococcus anophagefferens]|nr:hypothetical protein JL721_4400 [Aureococcus anophagefferens]